MSPPEEPPTDLRPSGPAGVGQRLLRRWQDLALSPDLAARPVSDQVLRFVVAHLWSGWWVYVSVAALVWTALAISSAVDGEPWSLLFAALGLAIAAGTSALGVGGARWILEKPLRTWWYAAPVGVIALVVVVAGAVELVV